MNYQLELKQIVDFPRCRDLPGIYTNPYERQKHPYQRRFLSFYFLILCSYKITAPLIGTSNTLLRRSCSWRMDLFS